MPAQRLVISYVYDLPFGRGQRYLSGSSKLVAYTVGGWGLGRSHYFDEWLSTGIWNKPEPNEFLWWRFKTKCRSQLRGKEIKGSATSRLHEWFNSACFTQPAAFTFGNEPRLDPTLRAPGVANWDASAYKNFPVTQNEKINLQFRAEAFNLFNRVQFGYPGLTEGQANFGVVNNQLNNPRLLQFSLRVNY